MGHLVLHSIEQLVLLYQVYSNWCLYNELILLNYLHLEQVKIPSIEQLVLLYQVLLTLSLSSSDVPFINGTYTHGKPINSGHSPAFYSLRRSGISSDSSLFRFFYFIHSLYKPQTTNIFSLIFIKIILLISYSVANY